MKYNAPDHYSHSYQLRLETLPTKKSDRIALRILYPGLLLGAILMFLGVYELLNGFKYGKTDFNFVIPTGEGVVYEPFLNPTFFDVVIILIGLWVMTSLIISYIRYKKIFFDGKNVTIVHRLIFGPKKTITESIKNYEGVRFRIEFFQFGFLTKNKYIIELYHKNLDKIAPLYISTREKKVRKIWEYYAKQLNLPTLVMTDEGVTSRDVKDLDKSLRELAKEKLVENTFDDSETLPSSIAVVRKGDKTVIKARKIFWDAYNIMAWVCLILFGGILLHFSINFEKIMAYFSLEFIIAFYVVGCFIIIASVFALFRKDKIVLKKDKIVIVHKFMLFSRKNNEMQKNDVEAIEVTANPATGRCFLAIISDNKTVIFGKKLPIEELRWVKKFLINEIIK